MTATATIDEIYAAARAAGALGGKLLGAGGGGFLLLFAPPERQEAVQRALGHLIHVPFKIENSGSQIIFFDAERDYSQVEAERASAPPQVFRELSEIRREEPA